MSGAVAIAGAAAAGGAVSTITAIAVSVSDLGISEATAAIIYYPDGTYSVSSGSFTEPRGNWVNPATAASQWEIRATLASGDTPTGTLGTWLPLSSSRLWRLSRVSTGVSSCNLTFEFRRNGGSVATTLTNNLITAEVI